LILLELDIGFICGLKGGTLILNSKKCGRLGIIWVKNKKL
jgi:hypothetical protein